MSRGSRFKPLKSGDLRKAVCAGGRRQQLGAGAVFLTGDIEKKNSCGEHTGDVRVIARRDGITAQHLSQSLERVTATGSAEPFKSGGLIKSARPMDGGLRASD